MLRWRSISHLRLSNAWIFECELWSLFKLFDFQYCYHIYHHGIIDYIVNHTMEIMIFKQYCMMQDKDVQYNVMHNYSNSQHLFVKSNNFINSLHWDLNVRMKNEKWSHEIWKFCFWFHESNMILRAGDGRTRRNTGERKTGNKLKYLRSFKWQGMSSVHSNVKCRSSNSTKTNKLRNLAHKSRAHFL